MKESTLQLVNYIMILVLLVTLALHLAMQAFLGVSGYADALSYQTALSRYRDGLSVSLLTILLVAATYHGLFGLRNILLEWRPGRRWHGAVTGITLGLAVVMLGWGLRTIVFAFGGA
jgi:succinate dehydrogenase / fumarate reductase membrane anchor subunit